MAIVPGVGGLVKQGGVTVASLNHWELSIKVDTKDSTAFQASGNWAANLPTIKHWTAKASGWLDAADTNGQVALISGLATAVTVELDTVSPHNFSGSAYIVGLDPKADVNGLITADFSFTGTGAITYT